MLALEVIMRGSGNFIGFPDIYGKALLDGRSLSLCFFLFFTFWVASWKWAREAFTSRPPCFYNRISRGPKWSNTSPSLHLFKFRA
jgi:hypothetical protein